MATKEVHLAPIGLAVLGAAGLTAIWVVDGLPAIGWMAALAYLATSTTLLINGLRRRRAPRLGWANLVTATRSTLVAIITGLVAASFVAPISVPLLIGLVVPALGLDAVDGWIARRTGTIDGARRSFRHGSGCVPPPRAQRVRGTDPRALGAGDRPDAVRVRRRRMDASVASPAAPAPLLAQGRDGRAGDRLDTCGIRPGSGTRRRARRRRTGCCSSNPSVGTWCGWRSEAALGESRWVHRDRRTRRPAWGGRAIMPPAGVRTTTHVAMASTTMPIDSMTTVSGTRVKSHVSVMPNSPTVRARTSARSVAMTNSRLSTVAMRQESPVEDEHPDRQHEGRDGVQDEEHAEQPPDAVEDEEEMDPADREQDDRAEDPHDHQNGPVVSSHIRTRFRSKPPAETLVGTRDSGGKGSHGGRLRDAREGLARGRDPRSSSWCRSCPERSPMALPAPLIGLPVESIVVLLLLCLLPWRPRTRRRRGRVRCRHRHRARRSPGSTRATAPCSTSPSIRSTGSSWATRSGSSRASIGGASASGLVVLLAVAAVGLIVALSWAALRVGAAVMPDRVHGTIVISAVTAAWIIAAADGLAAGGGSAGRGGAPRSTRSPRRPPTPPRGSRRWPTCRSRSRRTPTVTHPVPTC